MPKRRPQPAAGGRAYDFVKAAILAGGYKPETFLTEGEIAMRLGLSRTPVREALLRLEVEGLVSLHPKKGALVRSPSAQEVAELFEARGVLESFAAGRAWPYREELAQRLRPVVDDMGRHCMADEVIGFVEIDRAFHGLIVTTAGNHLIASLHGSLLDRQAGITVAALSRTPELMTAATEEHAVIVTALLGTDADRFLKVVRQHIDQAAQRIGGLATGRVRP